MGSFKTLLPWINPSGVHPWIFLGWDYLIPYTGTRGGLVAVRSSVSSAQNEHFVPIEHHQFVRDPSLTPPLPWLALLPDP